MKKVIKILIPLVLFLAAFAATFLIARSLKQPAGDVSKSSQQESEIAVSSSESREQNSGEEAPQSKDPSSAQEDVSGDESALPDSQDPETSEEERQTSEEDSSDEEQSDENSETSDPDDSRQTDPDHSDGNSDSDKSDASDSEKSHSQQQDTPDDPQNMPDELLRVLDESGTLPETLAVLNCQQLIVTESSGTSAVISFYQKGSDGVWQSVDDLTTYGYVGRNGVSGNSYEGSNETPAGLFPVGEAFYRNNKPETGLNSFQITPDTYWVDDIQSSLYNQKYIGPAYMGWSRAEFMYYIQNYEYGFVINFNMNPIIPGKGSAIFFHISSGSTAGCVGTSEAMTLAYLKVLDASRNPYILIL